MSEAVDITKHILDEVRGLRNEVLSGQREHREAIERIRDNQTREWAVVHENISNLEVKVTERNEQRLSDHRSLAQRVTLYAAIIAGGVTVSVDWARSFFFAS